MAKQKILEYNNFQLTYASGVHAVRGVSFHVSQGECLALVGESGCGKTTMALGALGLLPDSVQAGGEIILKGINLMTTDRRRFRALRGFEMGFVVQNPYSACNGLAKVQGHLAEAWKAKRLKVQVEKMISTVKSLGIDYPEQALRKYPHQWSGGMLQRATIGAASVHRPELIIADEPTSALDADRADAALDVLKRAGHSILMISHDIKTVTRHADRIAICYAGKVVEIGAIAEITACPRHPYTRGLFEAMPKTPGDGIPRPLEGFPPDLRYPIKGCAFFDRCRRKYDVCCTDEPEIIDGVACHKPYEKDDGSRESDSSKIRLPKTERKTDRMLAEVRDVCKTYRHGGHEIPAVRSANLKIFAGDIIGISGPSGCGKSTLLRLITTLEFPDRGEVFLNEELVTRGGKKVHYSSRYREAFLMPIFQDPVNSLDFRWPIWKSIVEPLTAAHRSEGCSRRRLREMALGFLKKVNLEMIDIDARPGELSVGQCQRISIARALAAAPQLILADEPTSALDTSVSAGILNLLADFAESGRAIVIVSHDRRMIDVLCTRILEMTDGVLREVRNAK